MAKKIIKTITDTAELGWQLHIVCDGDPADPKAPTYFEAHIYGMSSSGKPWSQQVRVDLDAGTVRVCCTLEKKVLAFARRALAEANNRKKEN